MRTRAGGEQESTRFGISGALAQTRLCGVAPARCLPGVTSGFRRHSNRLAVLGPLFR